VPDTRKLYLLGRDVTFSIFGAAANPTTGVWTYTSIGALTGVVETAEVDLSANLENILAGDTGDANWVKLGVDWELTLNGIAKKLGSLLRTLAMTYDEAKVVIVTPDYTWTFVGAIDHYNWSYARGKNPEKISFKRVDISGPNPTLVINP